MPQRAPAPAKARILAKANELFYGDGIRNVGVDRIIGESSVTKATFYKHYRAKDNLIVEYVTSRHLAVRERMTAIVADSNGPDAALRAIVADIVEEIDRPGFRGCPFINAAAEFPESDHPVRQIVSAHRDWYSDLIAGLMRELGHPRPGDAADEFVLARDGAMTGGYAGDPVAATTALVRATERVLTEKK
jgi:AcrR family transcriptional regulator